MASASITQRPQYVKSFIVGQRIRLTAVAFCAMLGSEVLLGCKPCNPLQLADPWVATGTVALLTGLLLRSWAAGMLVKKKRLASDAAGSPAGADAAFSVAAPEVPPPRWLPIA